MPHPVKLTIRLLPGKDDDLITWITGLTTPYGEKGETIKQALRQGMAAVAPQGDDRGLDTRALLADIRLVVEAAIETGLARHPVSLATPLSQAAGSHNDEIETALSLLDQALLVNEL